MPLLEIVWRIDDLRHCGTNGLVSHTVLTHRGLAQVLGRFLWPKIKYARAIMSQLWNIRVSLVAATWHGREICSGGKVFQQHLNINVQYYMFSCDQAALWMVQSVRPSHLFDYVPIIVSSWNFQELLPVTEVTSMQKVKVRGQRSSSQRSQPNFTVSGL